MQVSITGRHVVVTAALKSFVAGKLARLEELFPKVKKIDVVLSVEKYRHTAEIHFHADRMEHSATKTTKDMYASIESTVKALEAQAFKRRDKLRTLKSQREASPRTLARIAQAASSKKEAPALPRVVRLRRPEGQPLRSEEAAMELAEGKRQFLVYEDARSGRTQVMFKRDDGTFGLIEA